MTLKNFLALDEPLGHLTAGSEVSIGGSEGHHGARVMRLRVGELILLTDAHGHQAEGTVSAVGKSEFRLTLTEDPRTICTPRPRLILIQALAKGGRDELAIEFATELGVDEVIPWQADRSVVQWKGQKEVKGREKWVATIHSAVKQSRRASIPKVGEVLSTGQLAGWIEDSTADGCCVFLLHESASTGLSHSIHALSSSTEANLPPHVAIVVGPEGGVSEAEVELLERSGAQVVRLGAEILRASSAGPAALAALCAALGRW